MHNSNLKMAQRTAFQKKKVVEVTWRGYTYFVQPAGPEYNMNDLHGLLLLALREILILHKMTRFAGKEEEVYQALLKQHEQSTASSDCDSSKPGTSKKQKRKMSNGEENEVFLIFDLLSIIIIIMIIMIFCYISGKCCLSATICSFPEEE